MALKVAIVIFVVIMTCTLMVLIHSVMDVKENVSTMRKGYTELLKQLVDQHDSAFNHWRETIDILDKSVELNTKILEGITYKKQMNKAEVAKLMSELNAARRAKQNSQENSFV